MSMPMRGTTRRNSVMQRRITWNAARLGLNLGAALVIGGVAAEACTPPFTSCESTRSCPLPVVEGGAGGDGAEALGGMDSERGGGGQGGGGDIDGAQGGMAGEAAGGGGEIVAGGVLNASGGVSEAAAGTSNHENAGAAGEANAHPCDPNPCVNGGTCAERSGAFSCTCDKSFTGARCELPRFELVKAAPFGVSADGLTLVGASTVRVNDTYLHRAVIKTGSNDLQVLGLLPGSTECEATATNTDGTVVVGDCTVASKKRASRWAGGGQLQDLGVLEQGGSSTAKAISGDGQVIVGEASVAGITRAFRWTADAGLQDIGSPTANGECSAAATNRDGSIVTGYCQAKDGYARAFFWRAKTGAETSIDLLPSCAQSWGTAVTPDGTRVIGGCHGSYPMFGGLDSPHKSFRWNVSGKLDDLNPQSDGNLADMPAAITADGLTIVGIWGANEGTSAFAWDAANGQIDLMDYLAAKGLDTDAIKALDTTGHWFENAVGISADGKVIVGYFYGGGYIARLP